MYYSSDPAKDLSNDDVFSFFHRSLSSAEHSAPTDRTVGRVACSSFALLAFAFDSSWDRLHFQSSSRQICEQAPTGQTLVACVRSRTTLDQGTRASRKGISKNSCTCAVPLTNQLVEHCSPVEVGQLKNDCYQAATITFVLDLAPLSISARAQGEPNADRNYNTKGGVEGPRLLCLWCCRVGVVRARCVDLLCACTCVTFISEVLQHVI